MSGGGAVGVGVGVTIPLIGVGVYAGAGIANGTLLRVNAIKIGLLPALLAPIGALYVTANSILEVMVKIQKGKIG